MAKKNNAQQAVVATQNLTASEVDELIEVCLSTPMEGYPKDRHADGEDECLWGLPVLIEGEPGIAKTARLKQLAKAVRIPARSLFAAQHPPEDFSGALIPDGKGGANQMCPLLQVRDLIEEGTGIIFLDEINGAPPATQGALQSFIHERVAGDQILPGRIRIVSAQNPADIATGGFALSSPLANRFVHFTDPGPNAREWATWLMGTSKQRLRATMKDMEDAVTSDWPNLFPESQALFSGFMENHGAGLLHKRPPLSDPQSSKAWPSHRTWDYALRAYTAARILEKNDSVRDAIIEACVGPGAAATFLTYMQNTNIPKPMEVLNGSYDPDPNRVDIVLAAYTGMVAYVRQRPTRKEQMELAPKAWASLKKLFPISLADICEPASRGLVQEKLGRNSQDPTISKAASEVLVKMSHSGIVDFVEAQI